MEGAYEVYNLPYGADAGELPSDAVARIEAFAFRGHETLGPDIMDAFPKLGMIANFGAEYNTIDVTYATSKGIKVTNTPDVLTDDVADLAVGILLAALGYLRQAVPGQGSLPAWAETAQRVRSSNAR